MINSTKVIHIFYFKCLVFPSPIPIPPQKNIFKIKYYSAIPCVYAGMQYQNANTVFTDLTTFQKLSNLKNDVMKINKKLSHPFSTIPVSFRTMSPTLTNIIETFTNMGTTLRNIRETITHTAPTLRNMSTTLTHICTILRNTSTTFRNIAPTITNNISQKILLFLKQNFMCEIKIIIAPYNFYNKPALINFN